MRNHLLLLTCLFLLGTSAFAQQGLKFGLRFSPIVSFATITDSSNSAVSDDISSKAGLSYGLVLNYGFTDNIGFQSGIHIVTKGYKRNNTVNIDSGNVVSAAQNVKMTTVEIPLSLRGRSPEIGDGLFITGQFGISLDISAGYKNNYEGVDPVTIVAMPTGTKNGSKFITPVNLSFIFGAGVNIEQDWGTVATGISYHRGLTNMNNKKNFGNQESIRMSYLALDLAYLF